MENHYQLSDEQFLLAMETRTLNPKFFDHEAHLRFAYLLIDVNGIDAAVEICCKQIKDYASFLGAKDKFNKTVTVAAVKAVYHFMLKSETKNFKDLIKEFPRLKNNFKELLSQHYGIDIFNDAVAKSSFLEPDLLPFD